MKDPSDDIRDWLFTLLSGNVTYGGSAVPVYSLVPKDKAMPYIYLGEQSSPGEDGTKDTYITRQSFAIETYTSSTGNDSTYVPVNTISDSVMQLVRVRTSITISGFNVVSVTLDNMITDVIDTGVEIVIYKIMYFTMIIEEN